MKPTVLRWASTLTATAILVFALIIALSGAFSTRAEIRNSFDRQKRIQSSQLDLERLLRLQLDQETSVRGFTITRDPIFLDPYRRARADFAVLQRHLRGTLTQEHLFTGLDALGQFERAHAEWHRSVAEPLLHDPARANSLDRQKRGKALIDETRADGAAISEVLNQRADAVGEETQRQINRTLYTRAAWLVVFGLLAILFNTYQARLNEELDIERTTTETLQRAFQSEFEALPRFQVGTAYISASRHVAIGGDVFDLYRLTDNQALVLIADVSGKGVDAAVITAFIKFTIRGLALRLPDPANILNEFNTAFPHAIGNPYLFVSMLVGILDIQTRTLTYASGGHDSAYVRRAAGTVEQVEVTGPVLGVMEATYESRTIRLGWGDAVIFTTDGFTEARDDGGQQLQEGAMEHIARADGTAQQMVDHLIAALRERTRNHLDDDIAVLALKAAGFGDARA
ncbi:MAG: hypothetical protein NVS1B14_08460 [Vulcanimicrobiaceae bacterium]